MSRVILHIDMNAFFAACHVVNDPSLKGKPIAVGGNNGKGVLSTASYEARKYGVNSAMPVFMAKKKCPNLIIIESDFDLYRRKSEEFLNIIRRYSPIIEVASVDECYVDITQSIMSEKDPLGYIKGIQDAIYNETGLGCSIGVAPNKFLAKMASDYKKPMGITVIRKKDISSILWPIDIGDMFGVGKKTAPRLKEMGINTIGDLATSSDIDGLRRVLGKHYFTLVQWANGEGDDRVVTEEEDPKSIGNSVTLLEKTVSIDEMEKVLGELLDSTIRRMNSAMLECKSVSITIRYSDFSNVSRSTSFKEKTSDRRVLFSKICKLLEENYEEGREVRLLGVTLKNLVEVKAKVKQLNLFEYQQEVDDDKIKKIINEINDKLGYEAVKKASHL